VSEYGADDGGATNLALRRAARLLIIGPEARVLLFQYQDDDRTWWATPGGGLEGDETFEQAAAREALEELAIEVQSPVPLWSATVEFTFRGQRIRQHERYFLVRLSDADIGSPHGPVEEAHRSEGIVSMRWWGLEDIEKTAEVVFPADLRERLRALGFQ
jgi:8-oxo-dGTP pyrophosphatase MutT (NUDIX family)